MLYKAEYKDECFELIPASNHHKAILEVLDFEGKYGTLLIGERAEKKRKCQDFNIKECEHIDSSYKYNMGL